MVGALAMAAPLDDYTVQPCKKQRREEDPQSKTITNYFSPLSKTLDKGLCSPKSSSIADYFIRSPQSTSKERFPSDKTSSSIDGAKKREMPTTPVSCSAKPAGRSARQGKRTRLLKRLSDVALSSAGSGITGGDTAALLDEVCSHTANGEEDDDDVVFQSEIFTAGVTAKPLRRTSVDAEPSRASVISNASSDYKTSLMDTSLEVHVGDTPDNPGTLTVSFEEFMRCQMGEEEPSSPEGAPELPDTAAGDPEVVQLPSPKTLTVQAQVHLSPPLPAQNSSKMASIFTKSKVDKKKAELQSTECEHNGHVASKRKSNVVIQEEDLELAVIDVETGQIMKQKSTPTERQQFMKAFRQAGDASKPKAKKTPSRKKDSENHPTEEAEKQPPDQEHNEGADRAITKLKRKKPPLVQAPSDETPKSPGAAEKTSGETDRALTKLKRKKPPLVQAPSDETPKSPGAAEKTSGETDRAITKLKRNKPPLVQAPSDETPKSPGAAEKTSGETDRAITKLKRKKPPLVQAPSTETPKSPGAAEKTSGETDRAITKLKRKKPPLVQAPSTETPKSPGAAEKVDLASPAFSSPVLRRSLRQKSSSSSKSPERTSAESPILMSTPKIRTPCRKNDVYKAEVLTVPSDTESPIRMRFTRVTRRGKWRRSDDDDDDAFAAGCKKVSESSKKMRKAKQLLEKAKAIQQNLGKAETPQRRSSRHQTRVTQEPIVVTDTKSQTGATKSTHLRSLNDVLGKKVKKPPPGKTKEVKKKLDKGGVITIEDGAEGSEGSQDDEQFRARRQFLMSGLPDSLKRQIARTSAIMEAYSVSGSSFQAVVHVQQRDGRSMWSLGAPCCRLLSDLPPLPSDLPDIAHHKLSLGDFSCVSCKSGEQPPRAPAPARRMIPDVTRECLLEEIRSYNPPFPVRRFLKQFLRKQSDSLQDADKSAVQEPNKKLKPAAEDSGAQEVGNGTKRKRRESPGAKCKRRKPGAEEAQSRDPEPDVVVIDEERSPPAEDALDEDVLWTEKYQPHSSDELIGNSLAVRRLHSWLKEWKMRAEKEEKRSQMQKTVKEKDDTWSAADFHDSEDSDEDSLCNTLLISGPPGVGKTAAVYACAQELGFKVFEVNASCQRSGRQILAQLKEATQSHQVDQQGVGAHKPCFFSSSSIGRSPRKLNSPKRVVCSPRKPPVSPRGAGLRKGLAPKSLSNFFLKSAPKQKQDKKHSELVAEPAPGQQGKRTDRGSTSEETRRKTATSLILFEEVDVIFDDDTGFLGAIKTFMSTTKRPVVLTTSDPTFGMMFDGAFEEISFHTPSVVNVTSFLQTLCLTENLRTDPKDVTTFLTTNRCDIRQSILQLQYWARSGGGRARDKPLPDVQALGSSEAGADAVCEDPAPGTVGVPGCHMGCAENLLGVDNIAPPGDLITFIKEQVGASSRLHPLGQLLAEFHSRKVFFTASNVEFLLPLPVHVEEPAAREIPEPPPVPDAEALEEDCGVKASATMKRRRKLLMLNDSDLFESDSNSMDAALSAARPEQESAPCCSTSSGGRRALSPAEQQASLLVCQCLDSMAEFADHISGLDCFTCDPTDPAYSCSPTWTQSRLKHGLCDALRTESRDVWSVQSCGEIRGFIEALSFHKCSSRLSKALDSSLELCRRLGVDPSEELTLRVPAVREQVYYGQPAATTIVSETRISLVRDVLSHPTFISLGNRDVNVTEYLPALRSICRIQKTKEDGKTKRRFLHYLEGIHLEFPRTTLSALALDFP
ncbi:ATPase family AAA domain-containing protein 5 [Engystomops pustulosus]|uniref:ATPase family AAA domain-containing protein 5 n=1 Tax=Engystomops pustulosus TaxID=76066 RepID=UPI003AFB5B6D